MFHLDMVNYRDGCKFMLKILFIKILFHLIDQIINKLSPRNLVHAFYKVITLKNNKYIYIKTLNLNFIKIYCTSKHSSVSKMYGAIIKNINT